MLIAALAVVITGGLSCGEEEPADCANPLTGGACAGVTTGELCAEAFCTASASCKATYHVQASASAGGDGSASAPLVRLKDAAAKATQGDCIALAAGTYGEAVLRGGVSLLGRGADQVTIKGTTAGQPALSIRDGAGGVLRGFTISGAGRGLGMLKLKKIRVAQVRLSGARGVAFEAHETSGLVIDQVEVLNTRRDGSGKFGVGLYLSDGTAATLSGVVIAGSAGQGALVVNSGLTMKDSLVKGNKERGIAIDCTQYSRCTSDLTSRLTNVTLDSNSEVGLWVRQARVVAKDLDIGRTQLLGGVGRGAEFQAQAELELQGGRIHDGQELGLFVDGSTGKLVGTRVEKNDGRGIWLQNVSQGQLLLQKVEVRDNSFLGVGLSNARGVEISGGVFSGTRQRTVIEGTGSVTSGDGLHVVKGSEVEVSAARFETNERLGVLIDASEARVTGSTIIGGKAALVVQNGSLDQASYTNNKGGGGKAIAPTSPSTPYVSTKRDLISSLPLPLP